MAKWLDEEQLGSWKTFSLMHLQLMARLSNELAETGLSMPDYLVLATLNDAPNGTRRLTEIGTELGWEKSRTSHHINRMSSRGLVKKVPCPSDLRGMNVVITTRGLQASKNAAPKHVRDVRKYFIDLFSEKELSDLGKLSARILKNLQQHP